jgi:predicted nucleic acid-binding protein
MFKRRAVGVDTALQLLAAYAAIPIRLMDVQLEQAVELAARLNIHAYDAYVIACALNQRIPALTLDRTLALRARELNVAILEVAPS